MLPPASSSSLSPFRTKRTETELKKHKELRNFKATSELDKQVLKGPLRLRALRVNLSLCDSFDAVLRVTVNISLNLKGSAFRFKGSAF